MEGAIRRLSAASDGHSLAFGAARFRAASERYEGDCCPQGAIAAPEVREPEDARGVRGPR